MEPKSSKSPLTDALEKCELLGPIAELVAGKSMINLWDFVLITLESVARRGSGNLDFENAIELQWKALKHEKNSIPDKASSNPGGSTSGSQVFSDDVNPSFSNLLDSGKTC